MLDAQSNDRSGQIGDWGFQLTENPSGEFDAGTKRRQFLDHLRLARSTRNGTTPFLPWLKNDKVVGVADEHTPEEIRRQQPIELCCVGILPGVCESEEGYVREFE